MVLCRAIEHGHGQVQYLVLQSHAVKVLEGVSCNDTA